jgi:aspartate dehydrogenase
VDVQQARALQRRLASRPPITSLAELIRRSHLVLEAASVDAAARVARLALRAHRSVFIMSVGGLLRDRTWRRMARRSRGKVYIPSGALAGLDGVQALAVGKIRSVSLTTRKPPRALAAAPFVRRRRLRLERLVRPTVLFTGSSLAAVRAFPQNTNVAAALTLASRQAPARVRVRVVADPTIRMNVHEVDVRGDCGRVRCIVESRPSRNPKTSELALRSASAALRRLFDPVNIGT